MLSFIKYFFYLAYNWNFSIAFYIIKNEIKGERKYGIRTTGADDLHSLEEKGIDISHATLYMPVSYDILEMFFEKADISSCKHLLDIGCGKGRALCVAAAYDAKKLSGVELSKELYLSAKENLQATATKYPGLQYNIYNNDAFYFEIEDDVDCIFMFNPFDDVIMSAVIENIDISLKRKPRKLTVIYINPLQKTLFADAGYKETFHFQKMKYLEGSIFEKLPEA